jgi:hypothetical protein
VERFAKRGLGELRSHEAGILRFDMLQERLADDQARQIDAPQVTA